MSLDGRLLAGVTVFSAVVECGSFARAGEALGISASGVSHAIARLETRMEVRLIERTTRAMSLTEEGRRFYDRVRPSLEEDVADHFGQPKATSLIARKLADSGGLTVASPAYLARRARPETPDDLKEHVCIDFWRPCDRAPVRLGISSPRRDAARVRRGDHDHRVSRRHGNRPCFPIGRTIRFHYSRYILRAANLPQRSGRSSISPSVRFASW